jgi:hypothetical protein
MSRLDVPSCRSTCREQVVDERCKAVPDAVGPVALPLVSGSIFARLDCGGAKSVSRPDASRLQIECRRTQEAPEPQLSRTAAEIVFDVVADDGDLAPILLSDAVGLHRPQRHLEETSRRLADDFGLDARGSGQGLHKGARTERQGAVLVLEAQAGMRGDQIPRAAGRRWR